MPFTLSQSIEKLQHFEISFDGKKKQCKIVIFGNFETSPIAMVIGNLRSVCYRIYGQVNICAKIHQYHHEAFFIVL
jgi:hypothetical protein